MSKKSGDYKEISPSEFFYRNKELAGFDNPVKAIYTAVRELVENSLDSCEGIRVLPDIKVRIEEVDKKRKVYRIIVEDNGSGVPEENLPDCFGKILYGTKYSIKQQRGRFGLGAKLAILYGQMTVGHPVKVLSCTGDEKGVEMELMIDIEKNKPIIISKRYISCGKWRGLKIEVTLKGDYPRARKKILELSLIHI